MESGDIIYILLMLAFFVFGIFNDSKKKKKKIISKSTQPVPPPTPRAVKHKSQPARPAMASAGSTHRKFQSSLDLVTDFEGESSLKASLFASDLFDNPPEVRAAETVHPILEQLRRENGQSEIRKAVIYSEILNRKY